MLLARQTKETHHLEWVSRASQVAEKVKKQGIHPGRLEEEVEA